MTYEIEDAKGQVIHAHHTQLRKWKDSPHYLKSAMGRQTGRSLCNDRQKTHLYRVESKERSNSSRIGLCWHVEGDSTTTTSGISDSEFENNRAHLTETGLSDERWITGKISETEESNTTTEHEDTEENSEFGETTIDSMTEDNLSEDRVDREVLVDEINLRSMEIYEEVEDEVNPWVEVEPRPEYGTQIENVVNNVVYPVGLPT